MATYKRQGKRRKENNEADAEALVVRRLGKNDGSRLTFISARPLEVLGNYLNTISKLLEVESRSKTNR